MQSSDELWEQSLEEIMDSIPDLIFESPSPKASCKGPKGPIGKPMRRRSRSSKKAPTTLLKADAKNFRALVQQFTGCHSAAPLLRAYKGPINLNFKQRNYYPEKQQKKLVVANFKLHQESDRAFGPTPFAAAGDDHIDGELFVSRMGQSPRADHEHALTYDMYDNIWEHEMSGPGDYSTVLAGAVDHQFWGLLD